MAHFFPLCFILFSGYFSRHVICLDYQFGHVTVTSIIIIWQLDWQLARRSTNGTRQWSVYAPLSTDRFGSFAYSRVRRSLRHVTSRDAASATIFRSANATACSDYIAYRRHTMCVCVCVCARVCVWPKLLY